MIFKPMRLKPLKLILAVGIMFGAVLVGLGLKPDHYWAEYTGVPNYEKVIPQKFGDWEALPNLQNRVVNPVQEESLKRIYSETFARTYVHKPTGRGIMLSIAYGKDQTNDTQLHTPEQCYPSQGFKVVERSDNDINTPFGVIKAVRLITTMGAERREPLTFFVRVGDEVTRGSRERNLARIHLAVRGYLADGTLVRVSEVTRLEAPFDLQNQFLSDLLKATSPQDRRYLVGQRGA
jgi:EpsI family protein